MTEQIRRPYRIALAILLSFLALGVMNHFLSTILTPDVSESGTFYRPPASSGVPYKPAPKWGVPYRPRVSKSLSKSEQEAFDKTIEDLNADFAARQAAAWKAALESPRGRAIAARSNLIDVWAAYINRRATLKEVATAMMADLAAREAAGLDTYDTWLGTDDTLQDELKAIRWELWEINRAAKQKELEALLPERLKPPRIR